VIPCNGGIVIGGRKRKNVDEPHQVIGLWTAGYMVRSWRCGSEEWPVLCMAYRGAWRRPHRAVPHFQTYSGARARVPNLIYAHNKADPCTDLRPQQSRSMHRFTVTKSWSTALRGDLRARFYANLSRNMEVAGSKPFRPLRNGTTVTGQIFTKITLAGHILWRTLTPNFMKIRRTVWSLTLRHGRTDGQTAAHKALLFTSQRTPTNSRSVLTWRQ